MTFPRRLTAAWLAPLMLGVHPGCADGEHDDHDHDHDHEPVAVQIAFDAVVGDAPAACGAGYIVGVGGEEAELADARLFVSSVELRVDGGWVPLTLDESAWQHEGVVLLDFEDGTAACADSGTPELNAQITGQVASGVIDGVRFDIGVPFALNHQDSAMAPAPLNSPGMFWTWQGGYKFVRVDWAVDGADRWNIHVGSTGCVSAAPTVAPAEACTQPNLSRVTLDVDPTVGPLTLDLGALVEGADLVANTLDTPPGCMSSPTEPDDCGPVFDALGLDFATGACTADCADQVWVR
jgi:uncharacterized repeat protein (TIGR04052 family)